MKRLISRIPAFFILCLVTVFNSYAETYFVSLNGDDSNPGSIEFPFQSINKGIETATSGDTIFVRAGTYPLNATIQINKSGTETMFYHLMSYPGERALLDFSAQALSGSNRGIYLTASYWHIEGFDIFGAGDNGMNINNGSFNRIVNCAFYRNRDTGLQMGGGASYNQVINCDSYYNADPPDYGDADGFAAKLDIGVENYFYGCRAWKNCDDGWDGYLRGSDNVSTIIENSWAFENGYLENGSDPGPQANGNGFKMGGSDDKTLRHDFILKNCLSFKNKAKGFDQNSNMGSMTLFNCSAHNNTGGNYVIYKPLATGKELVIKNCLVLGETGNIANFAIQAANSWLGSVTVSEADFVSINESEAYGIRNEDGSLPYISYLQLAEGSNLIDAGVDVGLNFHGSAPDLGCFESDYDSSSVKISRLSTLGKSSCYPNPASEKVNISFSSNINGNYSVFILDVQGRIILQTKSLPMTSPSTSIEIQLPDLTPGMYLYRVAVENEIWDTGKLFIW